MISNVNISVTEFKGYNSCKVSICEEEVTFGNCVDTNSLTAADIGLYRSAFLNEQIRNGIENLPFLDCFLKDAPDF